MKTLLLYLLFLSFFIAEPKNFSKIHSNKATTCNILQETVLYLKKAIPSYEKDALKPFLVNCEEGEVYGFNIHDMLDTANYIQYNRGKFKIMPNHLYHIYAWEYAFSTSNLMHVDKRGKTTFFEAVSCSNRGNSLKDVEEFINKTVIYEDERNELLRVLPLYKDFKFNIGHCGLASILDCEEN